MDAQNRRPFGSSTLPDAVTGSAFDPVDPVGTLSGRVEGDPVDGSATLPGPLRDRVVRDRCHGTTRQGDRVETSPPSTRQSAVQDPKDGRVEFPEPTPKTELRYDVYRCGVPFGVGDWLARITAPTKQAAQQQAEEAHGVDILLVLAHGTIAQAKKTLEQRQARRTTAHHHQHRRSS